MILNSSEMVHLENLKSADSRALSDHNLNKMCDDF